ncbi:MAG TPA: ABC transporter ATP-binding protein [Rickettsiales bacterium]|nr:ABC transporter ATP-binding protein [Rickettsiales bacterium]
MTSPAIAIKDLRKTYKDGKTNQHKEALKGITLEIPRGAFFGLLGPNGAGKSTLINIMAGLTNKTSGTVEICGHDIVKNMRAARSSIGVVPQELVLDTFFTVRQALEITAGYYDVPAAQRRTSEIIEAMGLSDKADMHPRRLSGGMRRRLLIAKALVHSPQVLVLDEPTAGVDVELRTQLWEYVRQLNKQGTTILLTTHYLEEAEELCDQIAIINHGEVIACDRKQKLMSQFDSKQLTLKLTTPLTAIPDVFADLNAALSEEGDLTLQYRPSEANIEDILGRVRASGLSIRDLATTEADLQDVFQHLTRKKVA